MGSAQAKAIGRVVASVIPLVLAKALDVMFPNASGGNFLVAGAVLTMVAVALIYHDRIPGIRISKVRRKFFDGETVYLRDVMDNDGLLSGKTFVKCTIVGPGILVALGEGVHVDAPDFLVGPTDGPDSSVYVAMTPGQKVIGYVPVKDSTFRRCHFMRIAIVARKEQIDAMKAAGKLVFRKWTETPVRE